MTAATFPESIAGRDLFLPDASHWDTGTPVLPNGDRGTVATTINATSSYTESGAHEFAVPWGVSDWSLELWVRYVGTPPGTGQNLVGRYGSDAFPGTADFDLFQDGTGSPRIAFRLGVVGGGFAWAETPAMVMGAVGSGWHHVVFTVNTSLGSGAVSGRQVLSYKDGALYATLALPATAVTVPTLTGPRLWFGSAGRNPVYIERAKLAIYRRQISAGEVLDHYLAMTT